MTITPGKDTADWAAFNTQYRVILSPAIKFIAFLITWLGSIYGIFKALEHQFPTTALPIACAASLLLQLLNSACMPVATRLFPALCLRNDIGNNVNQRVGKVGVLVGLICAGICAGAITADYLANQQANKAVAESTVQKKEDVKVDTRASETVMGAAEKALNAMKDAEKGERAAYEAQIERKYANQTATLNSRLRVLAGKGGVKWAVNESNSIQRKLASMKSLLAAEKAAFTPKKTNLAKATEEYAKISNKQSGIMLGTMARADTINHLNLNEYQEQKVAHEGILFFMYSICMGFLLFVAGLKEYRAIRYDEKHPDGANPLIAIIETIAHGLSNWLWQIRAKIYDWLPEDELNSSVKADLLAKVDTQLSQDVFNFIRNNQGTNEMGIYLNFKTENLADVRMALRVLKTAHLVAENSQCWTADEGPAASAFFLTNRPAIQS